MGDDGNAGKQRKDSEHWKTWKPTKTQESIGKYEETWKNALKHWKPQENTEQHGRHGNKIGKHDRTGKPIGNS